MQSIRRSDYLSFGYQSLADYEGPLVVFGHSLSDADQRIVQAIQSQKDRQVAVGLLSGSAMKIIEKRRGLTKYFPGN
jgi:hypothetical protein